jgi:hypothetical protein
VAHGHLEEPLPAARHVLGRPAAGRLFVIAAVEQGALAKRFRRRALLAFLGFAAAVYALGWLLQGVLGSA